MSLLQRVGNDSGRKALAELRVNFCQQNRLFQDDFGQNNKKQHAWGGGECDSEVGRLTLTPEEIQSNDLLNIKDYIRRAKENLTRLKSKNRGFENFINDTQKKVILSVSKE
jgi:hypothetical protein